jgi:hypothetical protein
VEADECYYIVNKMLLDSKGFLDLKKDPPPDLAIEAEISETSIPKKPIYARLGVPELWRANFDGIMVLRLKDKDYDAGEASGYFPRLDLKEFFGFVKIAMEDQFRAVKEFDAWLRGAGAKK